MRSMALLSDPSGQKRHSVILLRPGPPRPGPDVGVGVAAIAAVLAIYAITALAYDQPELPGTVIDAARDR